MIIFATTFAIIFTTLIYVIPTYKELWLYLEIIILPLIYYIGYEMLMDKQREDFRTDLREILEDSRELEEKNTALNTKNQSLQKEINKLKHSLKKNGKKD